LLSVPVQVIAWRTVFEITCNVSSGTLNLTHSLTVLLLCSGSVQPVWEVRREGRWCCRLKGRHKQTLLLVSWHRRCVLEAHCRACQVYCGHLRAHQATVLWHCFSGLQCSGP